MTLLYYGLFFLLGCATALSFHWVFLLPLLALLYLSKKPFQGVVLFAAAIAFTKLHSPPLDVETLEGYGLFHLEKVEPSHSPFQKSLALRGTFKTFNSGDTVYHNIPCILFQPRLPKKGSAWIIEGTLEKKGPLRFAFKPDQHAPWEPVSRFSLSRIRHEAKKRAATLFRKKGCDHRTGAFFASMATGNNDDRLLAMEFQKLGLGHILAISGFHFALLATLFGFLFRTVLPPKVADILLLVLLSLYFLYLGPTPSILRAYVMISLFLLGLIIGRRSNPLNLLGAALIVELFMDPLTITQVGFQLSFLATFALLAFYQRAHTLLEKFLPKRPYHELRQLAFLDLHGTLLTGFLRKSLALNLAVQLATLPLVLYTFKSFPLLSLIYNLILPPFLALSLALLPFSLFPPVAYLNAKFTKWVLSLIAHPPEVLNFKLFTPTFPLSLLVILLTGVLMVGLTKREKLA